MGSDQRIAACGCEPSQALDRLMRKCTEMKVPLWLEAETPFSRELASIHSPKNLRKQYVFAVGSRAFCDSTCRSVRRKIIICCFIERRSIGLAGAAKSREVIVGMGKMQPRQTQHLGKNIKPLLRLIIHSNESNIQKSQSSRARSICSWHGCVVNSAIGRVLYPS